MFGPLVRWLGRGAARVVGRWLPVTPREPTAEDEKGAGI
jgi:hypothetical protein